MFSLISVEYCRKIALKHPMSKTKIAQNHPETYMKLFENEEPNLSSERT